MNYERYMLNVGWLESQTLSLYSLLLQCRYTLQYTYPYAYYMESGPRKKLVRQSNPPLCFVSSEVPLSITTFQESRNCPWSLGGQKSKLSSKV